MNPLSAAARIGVRAIDLALQRHYHVFAFSDDPACLLKIALTSSAHDRVLRDGTHVCQGMPILELHFWNERLPSLPLDGPTLAWGIELLHRARHSLALLAAYLAYHPRLDTICALHGEFGFLELGQFPEMRDLLEHLGFEFIAGGASGYRIWRLAFWQNLFSWWLMWTFNPVSVRGKHLTRMARGELWMSRARLMDTFRNVPEGEPDHLGVPW